MEKRIALFVLVCFHATCASVVASDSIDSGNLIAISQLGHSGAIFSVVVSSDGQYALSGGDDTNIKLWNLETEHEIRTFSGHTGNVIDLVISNDSRWAASIAQNDLSVRFWDLNTGKSLGVLKHDNPIQSIALSPNERFLLAGSDSLILWNLKTKEIEQNYNITSVNSIAYSASGKQVITGSDDGRVNLLNIENGGILKTFRHKKAISAVAFHPTKPTVISGSYDNTVNLWDINSGNLISSLKHERAVLDLSISDDGLYIASGGKDKKLLIWNLADYSNVVLSNTERINTVAFVAGKHNVLAGGRNKLLAVWDGESKRRLHSLQKHASTEAFLTNYGNSNIISVSNYKQLSYWNVKTGQILRSNRIIGQTDNGEDTKNKTFDFITSATGFVDSENFEDSLIAVGDKGGMVVLIKNGTQVELLAAHQAAVSSIAFSAKGDQLVTGSYDFTVQLWNIKSRFGKISSQKSHSFKHNHQVVTVAFSPDGNSVLTSSLDNLVVLWDTQTGKELKRWDLSFDDLGLGSSYVFTDFSNGVPFETKEGKYIYFLANGLRRINTQTKTMELLQDNFEPGEYTIALSPEGHSVLIGKKQPTDSEGSLFLWNSLNNRQLVNFGQFKSPVLGIQFANQGKTILASSLGGLHYFDRNSQRQIGKLSGSLEGESIFVTDDNYFNNTDEGTEEIILRPENGKNSFSFDQVADKLKKPDIINARINGDRTRGRPAPSLTTPPILGFVNKHEPTNDSNQVELHIEVKNKTPLKNIFIYVNGRPIINKSIDKQKSDYKFNLPLFNQMNRITVVGFDENGMSSNPIYKDVFSSRNEKNRSTLYIIGIGVSKYPNLPKSFELQYAHSDVSHLTQTFEKKMTDSYGKVNKHILLNSKATKQGIKKALESLKDMKQNDMAIIHLAGHGIRANDDNFYFLTSEITDSQYTAVTQPIVAANKKSNIDEINQIGMIDWTFLETIFSTAKGQILLFLDACHSADLVKESITPNNDLANRLFSRQSGGVIVFSAAKGRETAKEDVKLGAGFFTDSIVNALNKPNTVDSNRDGYIDLMELVKHVKEDVSNRSGGSQMPWLSRKTMFGNIMLIPIKSQ